MVRFDLSEGIVCMIPRVAQQLEFLFYSVHALRVISDFLISAVAQTFKSVGKYPLGDR